MVRAVVDTNVLISALITPRRKPRQLVTILLRDHTLIMSPETIDELLDVASREKINEKREVKRPQVNQFIKAITRKSQVVRVTSRLKVVLRDPDDDAIINAAIRGRAEYIVTGDKDLLALGAFKKIQIVSVNQMLEILR